MTSFLGPFHILSYGTLLGVEIFQSFIGGVTAYRSIPRPHFAALQNKLFPIYFSLQSALPVALALTFPGNLSSLSSLSGVIQEQNRLSVLLPLSLITVSGLINLLYLTPIVNTLIQQRLRQETIDGKKSYDAPPHSPEMADLNKRFGKLHGASTLINLGAIIATVVYGIYLGGRIQ